MKTDRDENKGRGRRNCEEKTREKRARAKEEECFERTNDCLDRKRKTNSRRE